MQHQPHSLLEGHARYQVRYTQIDRQPPILVPVNLAIAVQIPELQPKLAKNRRVVAGKLRLLSQGELIARARRRGLAQQRGRRGCRDRGDYQTMGALFEHGYEPLRQARDGIRYYFEPEAAEFAGNDGFWCVSATSSARP